MMRRRGGSVVFYEMMRLVVMRVYKPGMVFAGAGWPIGGTGGISFWKAAAVATAMLIEYQ
jgi:hypothetical protein